MLSYVLPTRDRPEELARTIDALGRLDGAAHERVGGGEVIVLDNASAAPVRLAEALPNGLRVRVERLERNMAAAARNLGVAVARGEWIVMLDDDSSPLDCGHIEAMLAAPDDVAAIGAEITLPSGVRESGGLPEVIIGCGALVRREAFERVGGYDASFHYYVEEYDLCARFLLEGMRVLHDRRFRVEHRKAPGGRSMNTILRRLVRNNAWVAARYAPRSKRRAELRETLTRYARIARKERALPGYALGVCGLAWSLRRQKRRAMDRAMWARFTGLAHARDSFAADARLSRGARAAVVNPGKNAWAVRQALVELGVKIVESDAADVLVVGTLSPGPMLDAQAAWLAGGDGRPVITAWTPAGGAGEPVVRGASTIAA